MMNIFTSRKRLRGGSALQALALLGAGVGTVAGFAAPAAAQDYTNVNASGTVNGTGGKAIPNATVTITSDEQGFTRTATTSNSGSYRVAQIPAGRYTFTVTAPGYQPYTEAGIQLTQASAGNSFTLISETVAANSDIVVTGTRQQVSDFDQATTGAVISVADVANRVPVARDLTSIIQLAPGTSAGDSAFGNLASINGSSVAENVYYVNGLNITNFRTFLGSNSVPFEFYDTVEVKNGGYNAEFGRNTGGAVIATTKSGTNEFHAGAVVTWEPDELASDRKNTYSQDNDGDYASDLRADFYVSGPIIKDHLFFYGLYEARDVKTGGGGILSRQYGYSRSTSPFFAGKVDAVITDGQRLEFTYFRTTGHSDADTFAYDPDTNKKSDYFGSQLNQYGGDNYVARYTGSFTDWFTISAAYGKSKDRDNSLASTDTPLIYDYRSGVGRPVGANNPYYFQEQHEDEREFYRADADVFFHLLGDHHVRFGFDHENLSTTGVTNYSTGAYYQAFNTTSSRICGAVVPPGGCDYWRVRTYENGGTFHSRNEAYYIQDSWKLFDDRLSLNLGIRNDHFENDNIDGVTYYKSGDQWGPRVSFAFDVLGDRRSKLYGSFGRYFLPIATNTNIRLGGAESNYYQYYGYGGLDANGLPVLGAPVTGFGSCAPFTDGTNCTVVSDGSTKDTTTTVSKNLKPQSVDEYIIGYEQRVGQYWKFGAFVTYRTLNRALEDVAVDGAARVYCRAQGYDAADCSSLYGGFSQYVLINPGEDAEVTLYGLPDGNGGFVYPGDTVLLKASDLGYPKVKRDYKALTVTADREFDGKWSLSASYTLSAAVGNYEGAVTSDNGQTDAGLTQDFDQPDLAIGSYGYLPNHHRHNFKLYGSYAPTDWLILGANVKVQSQRKYGCFGLLPADLSELAQNINDAYGAAGRFCPYKDGKVSNDYPNVEVRRGTGPESDWTKSVDVSAVFKLPLTQFDAAFRVDVFNVFNDSAVTDLDEFGTFDDGSASDTYGLPINYQQPRYARFQIQLRF